jgi:nicotinate dehydrogenase subunit B
MTGSIATALSRRSFLRASGLVVAFSMAGLSPVRAAATGEAEPSGNAAATGLPDDLQPFPYLDSWIRLGADGRAEVFTGKVELGQGIMTALLQVAAEELDMPAHLVSIVTADTARTPDEGLTAASHSMQYGGPAIRLASANVRMLLLRQAARMLSVGEGDLSTTGQATILAANGRTLGYGAIAAALSLHVAAVADAPLRQPNTFRTMGQSLPRLDIPAKVTGAEAFIQDMRLAGMLHARVIRAPAEGMKLTLPSRRQIEAMPGLHTFVQNGDFAAIVCEKEWDAVRIMRHLMAGPSRRTAPAIPTGDIESLLKSLPANDYPIEQVSHPSASPVKRIRARYSRPWYSHGSIGPSCALAQMTNGELTIWSHSQGIFDVRRVASSLLDLPEDKIHAIHVQGAGCYGQNGADDVAADVALIAAAIPERPIRLQWMREQEFGWEPLGAGMVTEVEAGLDAQNRIVTWNFDVWSPPHNTRPTSANGVLAGWEVANAFQPPVNTPIPMPAGDGSRNANPLYALANMDVNFHFIPKAPFRSSALRSLGAHLNVFSIESMFDELATEAQIDPLDLRLNHMEDARARAVMMAGAEAFGWRKRQRQGKFHGFGMGFARYKNLGAYCSVFMEIDVEQDTGIISVRRAQAAVDCGEVVNPDGVRNQVEGGIIQSLSWCTQEAMTYDADRRTSFDWSSYPILRFCDVPLDVAVTVLPMPGEAFLGVAEASQGPTSAALANALADATGIRLREMPLTPEKVRQAIVAL